MNEGIPQELCAAQPALKDYGFYRQMDDGTQEFMAFCNPLSEHWLAIYDKDLENILNETLPKPLAAKVINTINRHVATLKAEVLR